MPRELRVAVLGLGEAGGRIAADLAAAGARVAGWDPVVPEAPAGVRAAGGAADAVAGAELVLSVNAAAVALAAAREAAPALAAGCLYADLNTAAPQLKEELAAAIEPSGALFVDVALMAPVPGRGLRTPCLVSGPGADGYAALCRRLGVPVETVGAEPGAAATRKLLRSVFMKGLAAAAVEAVAAARAAGCEPWLREELAATLEDADDALLTRLLEGSSAHAKRRVHEMEAAAELLRSLGLEPRVAEASAGWLRELERGRVSSAR